MRAFCPRPGRSLALAVAVVILVSAVSVSVVQLTNAAARCADQAPERCAGLWSSQCCDFVVPRTKDDPQSSLTARLTPLATTVPGAFDSLLPRTPEPWARTPEEPGGDPPLPPHLSTTILLL